MWKIKADILFGMPQKRGRGGFMKACSSFIISVSGSYADILEAVDYLSETIIDQSCWTEFAKNYSINDSDDYDEDEDQEEPERDDKCSEPMDECFEVWDTQECVWIEDIQKMAAELSYLVPKIDFVINGYTEDNIDGNGDRMNFLIEYKNGKLTSRISDWYIHIYIDDFEDYYAFSERFIGPDGQPRYTEEDYNGFLECADEWYVLDSGNGEFSTDVPLGKAVKIKIPKKFY